MKYKFIFLLVSWFASTCYAQSNEGCDVAIPDVDWAGNMVRLTGIDDVDQLDVSFPFTGKLELQKVDSPYIDITVDDTELHFKSNDNFADFIKNKGKQSSNFVTITMQVDFLCDQGVSSLTITLDVKDTNDNPPTFEQASYEFTMPMPLVPRVDLTTFGESIIVTDLDFSNQDVTFDIEPKDVFVLETETLSDPKNYRAIVRVSEYKRYSGDTLMTITATDSGTPPLTTSVALKIVVDTDLSLPDIPTVPEVSYQFKYSTDDDGNPVVTSSDDKPITVTTSDPSKTEVALQGAEQYFTAKFDVDTQIVTIEPTETPLDIVTTQIMVLTLVITLGEDSSKAVILMEIPKENLVSAPTFSEVYYTAKYLTDFDPHTVVPDQTITVSSDDANVKLEGDYVDNFATSKVDGKWQIDVTTPLDQTIIDAGGDIYVTLHASLTADEDLYEEFATLVIQLPEIVVIAEPQFSNHYYTGDYERNEGGTDTVQITNGPIVMVDPDQTVVVTIVDSTLGDFSIKFDTDHWIITVATNLAQEDLDKGGDIILTLSAAVADSDVNPGYSTFIITLPDIPVVEIPKFTNPHYSATYQVDDTGAASVELSEGPITATSGAETVEISLVESSDYFDLVNDGDDWTVDVIKELPQEILDAGAEYVLTLQAKISGDDIDIGYATLIITVPEPAPVVVPEFSSPHYTATYDVTQSSLPIIDGPIAITSGTDVTVVIDETENYHDYFKIEPNSENTAYDLTIATNLEDEVLITEADIVLTLLATAVGVEEVGQSTLVIQLPKKTAPASFTQSLYTYDYNLATDPHTIDIKNGPIELDGNNFPETTVTLDGELKEKFTLSDTSPYELTLNENLDDTILNTEREIVLTLVASLPGSDLLTKATVTIAIPAVPIPPKFTQITYTAKYEGADDTAKITLENDETISTVAEDPASVTVTVADPYSSNFAIAYDDANQVYDISVATPLDSEIVDKETEIYVILDATVDRATDHRSATLVVKMPEKTENVVPKFSKTYYRASYNLGEDGKTDTVEIPDQLPITISSDHAADTVVTVIETYASNFKAEFDGTSWQFTVQQNLDDTILYAEKEIVVSLEASLPGSAEFGYATIIMDLPSQDLKAAPKFVQPHYTAEYLISDEGVHSIQYTNDTVSIDSTNEELVEVTLKDYDTNFKLTRDPNTKQWNIEKLVDLTEDDLKNTELIITLIGHLEMSVGDATATLLVKLPVTPEEIIKFDTAFYTATYTVTADDTDTITAEDITVTSGAAVIVSNGPYTDNFGISCEDTKCTLSVKADLADDILTSESQIQFALEASKTDVPDQKATATVIVILPKHETLKAPEFTQNVYTGTYPGGAAEISLTPPIQIQRETDANVIPVAIEGENSEYFTLTPVDDYYKLEAAEIPVDVINEVISIVFNLKATKTDVSVPGEAALVIELPKKTAPSAFHFENTVYMAVYNDVQPPELQIDPLKIEGDEDGSAEVTLLGEHKDFFDLDYAEGVVTITLLTPLDQSIIDGNVVVTLDITAALNGEETTTTVIIELPKTETTGGLEFTEATYTADYKIENGNPTIALLEPIEIKGATDVSSVDLQITAGDPDGHFNLVAADGKWGLEVKDGLAQDTIDTEISLLLTLRATQEDLSGTGTVVIRLPKKISAATFTFDDVVYMADYSIEDAALTPEKDITIAGDDLTGVTVYLSGDYKNLFKEPTFDSGKVTLELTDELPADVLSQAAISVEIVASNTEEQVKAAFVVRLPPSGTSGGLEFTEATYTADYKIENGNPTITLVEPIEIKGATDVSSVTVTITAGDPDGHFSLVFADSKWQLEIKEGLAQDTIDTEISLLLTLTATTPEGLSGIGTVVIRLPKKISTSTFTFDDVVYMADYVIESAKLTPEKDITIAGDDLTGVTVYLSGDYASLFKEPTFDSGKVTLELTGELSGEVLSQAAISVEIVASNSEEQVKAAFVVRLPPSGNSADILEFTEVAYIASYSVVGGTGQITLESGNIQLTGDQDPSPVKIEIEPTDLLDYFELTVDGDHWVLNVKANLPTDVIDTEISILLNLKAELDTAAGGTAVVIKLPKKVSPATFEFDDVLYMAEYTVTDDAASIKPAKDIVVTGNTAGLSVTLIGDYKSYFSTAIGDGKVTVTLKDGLPDDVLNTESAISVEIEASNEDEGTVKVAFVVKLPKSQVVGDDDSDDKTGLIAAVAVLAVLLVASLVGSAVFYYLKYRRGNSYSDMGEESRVSQFTRKSNPADSKKKFEHTTRRPTGLIAPNLEASGTDDPVEDEPSFEKRKSVQFDVINIAELEIEPEKVDDDLMEVNEDGELEPVDNDDRRSSRV